MRLTPRMCSTRQASRGEFPVRAASPRDATPDTRHTCGERRMSQERAGPVCVICAWSTLKTPEAELH